MRRLHPTEIVTEVGTLIGAWQRCRRIGPLREIAEVWPICLSTESDYTGLLQALERVLARFPGDLDSVQAQRVRKLTDELREYLRADSGADAYDAHADLGYVRPQARVGRGPGFRAASDRTAALAPRFPTHYRRAS